MTRNLRKLPISHLKLKNKTLSLKMLMCISY